MQRIISSYEDVLTTKLGRASCPTYEIRIKGNPQPTQSRPYQFTPVRMQALKQIVNKMLEQQVIEVSSGDWCCPAFVVPKRDENRFCMVCDFQQVNEHITLDLFPTSHIENLFQYMRDAKFFASLDLVEAYHQIPISEDSKRFTSFNSPFGQYQYNTILQGINCGTCVP